jgi:uncharacterized membrane protein YcaP (DUF421 family)
MFFDNWFGVARVLLVGSLAYVALVLLLRVSGKRTLSKMNAFDLIVTIALGSTLATVLLSKTVAAAEGVTAFAVLIFLQYAVTWLSVRSSFVAQLVKAEPRLLVHKGRFLRTAMKAERVTEEEILAAVRQQGLGAIEDVEALVLETDGRLAVLHHIGIGSAVGNVNQWIPRAG